MQKARAEDRDQIVLDVVPAPDLLARHDEIGRARTRVVGQRGRGAAGRGDRRVRRRGVDREHVRDRIVERVVDVERATVTGRGEQRDPLGGRLEERLVERLQLAGAIVADDLLEVELLGAAPADPNCAIV